MALLPSKTNQRFFGTGTKILELLTQEFQEGASYGSLNSTRSAIALISERNIAKDTAIQRFFKGVYNLRPSKPRYFYTRDPETVLTYLENLPTNKELGLRQLTEKTITLLALCTAHRLQTFALIQIDNICQRASGLEITIPDRIKTSRPKGFQPLLFLPFFAARPQICVASAIMCYLTKTKDIRTNEGNLFLYFKKSHGAASMQTLARWIESCLFRAGVDRDQFSAYSTKHAAVSAATLKGVDLNTIRCVTGWSERSNVFAKFYNRPVIADRNDFAKAILND